MPSGALMNTLYVLMYVLALILLVTGLMLLRFFRKTRNAKESMLLEAKVLEIARFFPQEADTNAKDAKKEQYCPIYEMIYEGQTHQFRGTPSPGTPQWLTGETVRLLFNPKDGTAIEWDKVRVSRVIGIAFAGLGLSVAITAAILQILN